MSVATNFNDLRELMDDDTRDSLALLYRNVGQWLRLYRVLKTIWEIIC